jgi:hypothetical protein
MNAFGSCLDMVPWCSVGATHASPLLLPVTLAVFEPGSRFLFDTARCSSPARFTINE